ncbi:GNAT family N-acetyltransferase [Novipirellula sp. SH528]|uniref:GNAT family N-acetyltransferase n=1 Tax=Novipirellula sp. SH528 TaxID=3454466 RepID=UPI003F9FA9E9
MHEIRTATSLDLPHAKRIYDSAIQGADWLPKGSRTKPDFVSATEGEDIFVSVNANRDVTGFISVWSADSFIHHLYVDPSFRRMGVGTALLASLDAWLPRPWTLKCVSANDHAMAFYKSLGWVAESTGNGPEGEYHLMRYA